MKIVPQIYVASLCSHLCNYHSVVGRLYLSSIDSQPILVSSDTSTLRRLPIDPLPAHRRPSSALLYEGALVIPDTVRVPRHHTLLHHAEPPAHVCRATKQQVTHDPRAGGTRFSTIMTRTAAPGSFWAASLPALEVIMKVDGGDGRTCRR